MLVVHVHLQACVIIELDGLDPGLAGDVQVADGVVPVDRGVVELVT